MHCLPLHYLIHSYIMKILNSLLTVTLILGSPVVLPAQVQLSDAAVRQTTGNQSAPLDPTAISPASVSSVAPTYLIAAGSRTATVFNPPSNVRDQPNGKIVCTITTRRNINVYRYYDNSNQWLYTDACGPGRDGVIHISQIRF